MRPAVAEMRWAFSWEAVAAGVGVFLIWVGLDGHYPVSTKSFSRFSTRKSRSWRNCPGIRTRNSGSDRAGLVVYRSARRELRHHLPPGGFLPLVSVSLDFAARLAVRAAGRVAANHSWPRRRFSASRISNGSRASSAPFRINFWSAAKSASATLHDRRRHHEFFARRHGSGSGRAPGIFGERPARPGAGHPGRGFAGGEQTRWLEHPRAIVSWRGASTNGSSIANRAGPASPSSTASTRKLPVS